MFHFLNSQLIRLSFLKTISADTDQSGLGLHWLHIGHKAYLLGIGYSMVCFGYGIYTRERSVYFINNIKHCITYFWD